jgi:hypothetical protein
MNAAASIGTATGMRNSELFRLANRRLRFVRRRDVRAPASAPSGEGPAAWSSWPISGIFRQGTADSNSATAIYTAIINSLPTANLTTFCGAGFSCYQPVDAATQLTEHPHAV